MKIDDTNSCDLTSLASGSLPVNRRFSLLPFRFASPKTSLFSSLAVGSVFCLAFTTSTTTSSLSGSGGGGGGGGGGLAKLAERRAMEGKKKKKKKTKKKNKNRNRRGTEEE